MAESRRAAAYGLALEGEEPLLALLGAPPQAPVHRTVMRAVEQAALEAAWPADGTRRLSTERPDPQAPPRTIDEHPEAGWRLDAPGWGCARVAPDGSLVECARGGAEEWRWQRFLVGRALPFAAVAAGLEVLHAAAVVVDGTALAVTGATGAGKSSVAAALVLAGAELLTDDVLAIEPRDGSVLAHPGPPLLALRDAEVAALGDERFRRVGKLTGEGGGKSYVAVAAPAGPVALGRLVVLRRTGEPGGVETRVVAQPPARVLLGAVFVPELTTPARLRGQLDLLELMSAGVEVLEARVGDDAAAGDVAEALSP